MVNKNFVFVSLKEFESVLMQSYEINVEMTSGDTVIYYRGNSRDVSKVIALSKKVTQGNTEDVLYMAAIDVQKNPN